MIALPDVIEAELGEQLQTMLVEQAATLDPAQLATAGQRIRDTLDPDATLTDQRHRERHVSQK